MQQISQQIFYGNVNNAISGGTNSTVNVTINQKDKEALINYFVDNGINKEDATELTEIMENETPTSVDEPFGQKAQKWISENIKKAAEGIWKIGVSTATKVFTEGALKYYG